MTPTIDIIDTPGLGDRSYLVHDGEVALVVDPQRDIDRILQRAAQAGVTITHVFETHVHNDYVSGGLALCRRTGATLVAAADDDLAFGHHAIGDGERVVVGSVEIEALHTPGHTHTHLSYVLHAGGRQRAVFTGGSLLYGTVGRTDLVGPDDTGPLTLGQWRSARLLADRLADDVEVFPTHGFGSFCSGQGGAERDRSTIADERADNLALTMDDADQFAERLLGGMTDRPSYYAHMALLNRAGPAEPDLSPPRPVVASELRRRLREGEWVLDLRSRRAFARTHLSGSAGFELSDPFATYVGWLIPWGSRLTLVAPTIEEVADAQRQLVRIGIDRPAGAAIGPIERLAPGHELASYPVSDFAGLAAALAASGEVVVLDVRRDDEWRAGHLRDAVHVPVHQLLDHLHHVPDGELWVHCASGARSSIAASLLARAGHRVVLVDDEFDPGASDAGLAVVCTFRGPGAG